MHDIVSADSLLDTHYRYTPVGERVFIEGLAGEPVMSAQVKKKKIWENVAKDLKTAEGAVATWAGKALLTSAGKCTAASLEGAPIS